MDHSPLTMRVLETLQLLLVASILGTILLAGSSVFADDSAFYFDESGRMQMNGYWSPNSRSKSDFETDRRMYNDQMNREALRQNEALIDSYHAPRSQQQPSYSDPNPPFLVVPSPGAMPRLCQRSFNAVFCQ